MASKCVACGDPIGDHCVSCQGYLDAGHSTTHIVGPNHALLTGQIAGALQRHEGVVGKVEVGVTDQGDYENHIFIDKESGRWRVTITPESVTDP